MEYLNFDILFDRVRKRYKARVLNSPGGQASIEFRKPFTKTELENLSLLRARGSPDGVGRSYSTEIDQIKFFGAKLFETVFSKDVRVCFHSSLEQAENQGKGLRVRLRLTSTPELADLPWEFLFNSSLNDFLALSVATPIVRFLDLPTRVRPLSVTLPLRILVMVSSPLNFPALNTELELNKLETALGVLIQQNKVALDRLEKPTLAALNYQLRNQKYHIFHFIGHGAFDAQIQDGVLVLEGEDKQGNLVSSEQMGILLNDHNTLKLVLLNACEGARASITDPFGGIAQSLVQQEIPAVIAMQREISDSAAITLSQEFYSALAQGYPVDQALTETRKLMRAGGNPIEWGIPVLYMRSQNGHIFNIDGSAEMSPETTEDVGAEGRISAQEVTDKQKKRIKKFRLFIITLFLIAAIGVGFLKSKPVGSSKVNLQLMVSGVSFKLKENFDLYSLTAKSVALSNPDDLALKIASVEQATSYDPQTNNPTRWQKIKTGGKLNINRISDDWGIAIESKYLSLSSLYIGSGAYINLSKEASGENQLKMAIRDAAVGGHIDTADTLILNCRNCRIEHGLQQELSNNLTLRIVTTDRQIAFHDLNQSLVIEMALSGQQSEPLAQNMAIESIDFTRPSADRKESTIIQEGIICFEELDREEIKIPKGEFVFVGKMKDFRIQNLEMPDNFQLSLQGEVGELITGIGKYKRSRLPSLLEWLYFNPSIALYFAILIPVFSFIYFILKRLKVFDWL
ncbi:CHAT domain-containing protein [candidate division KSB1 bacterium]|nr:CHAT domain-containing protein [candidate division KSB1 bacterium]